MTDVRTVRAAPPWIRALGSVVRRLPRGRYQIVSSLRSSASPFVSTLGPELGAARFACDLSDLISREVCLTGCYEPPVTRLLQRRLGRGGTMVDVGANWGYFTLLAAAIVGHEGRVISLEPDPRHFAALESNVRLNGFSQIQSMPKAAGANDGVATLAGYDDRSANRGVSRIGPASDGQRSFQVECVRIDGVTAGLDRVDVLKLDVEGGELDALEGMRDGLAAHRYRALLLELHPGLLRARGSSPEECVRRLLDAGYAGWTIDQTPGAYRRAGSPGMETKELLRPLADWPTQAWPHLLWLAPGEVLR
jgi:FkbM family methyltransferase